MIHVQAGPPTCGWRPSTSAQMNTAQTDEREEPQMSQRNHGSRDEGIPPITVVGVGGGGCNAVNRMISDEIRGVEFVAVNTDNQQLAGSRAETIIRIADAESDGLGVGGDPERGARAAENSRDEIRNLFANVDMAFITSGMGGGTGTGAAPIVAEIARQAGALTIAVVTRPFEFEGVPRAEAAGDGIARLNDVADTVIVIPNQRLIDKNDRNLTVTQAFHRADDVLRQAVRGISDVLTVPGEINLDFNDVKKIMGGGGHALMALGHGSGDNRAIDAVEEAIHSPLLENSIHGATRVLYNITSAGDLGMLELTQIADFVREQVHPNAEIIMGTVIDEQLDGDINMTLVATGFVEANAEPSLTRSPAFATAAPQAPSYVEPPQPSRQDILDSFTFKPVEPRNPDELATPAFLHHRQSPAEHERRTRPAQRHRLTPERCTRPRLSRVCDSNEPMRIDIVTIFPPLVAGAFAHSIIKRARDRGIVDIQVHDLRVHTDDRHRTVDDYPYGGGVGMVMKPEPWFRAVESLRLQGNPGRAILLTPQGKRLNQRLVQQLAAEDRLIIMCGRYEGVDERVREHLADEEISIGDYVLSGGEPAAAVLVDAVVRLQPGALGSAQSTVEESFSERLLEYPQYTRPPEFRGWRVPDILRSGDHGAVERWRRERQIERTRARRPDLLSSDEDVSETTS